MDTLTNNTAFPQESAGNIADVHPAILNLMDDSDPSPEEHRAMMGDITPEQRAIWGAILQIRCIIDELNALKDSLCTRS